MTAESKDHQPSPYSAAIEALVTSRDAMSALAEHCRWWEVP